MESFLDASNKPKDWPVNDRELLLERIYRALVAYEDSPGFRTREVIVSLACNNDLNQRSYYGRYRVTEFEAQLINILYLMGTAYQINAVKTCLYEIVGDMTRLQKMMSWCSEATGEEKSIFVEEYSNWLLPPLKLFYFAYQKYNLEKDKGFSDQIVEMVNIFLKNGTDEEIPFVVANALVSMLNDMGYMHGTKKAGIWKFSREELKKLFRLEADLISQAKMEPCIRPLRGVLATQISNYILKSRNDYNEDYICKYVSVQTAAASSANCQIWMKKTEKLNDQREQRVIPELFADASWIPYAWVKDIDFTATRTYFVSSFSKSINSDDMKREYGSCVYGFKNDKLIELLSPIAMQQFEKRDGDIEQQKVIVRPVCSQVLAFDVLYDREMAKEELSFLFEVIDGFKMSNDDKKSFLEHILQYWVLSVKDFKWKDERERRYVLFLYDEYNYKEIEIDDTYLKVKTSMFLLPDFILGKNPSKPVIKYQVDAARKALSRKDYIFCHNCLNRDYDAVLHHVDICPICNSDDIEYVTIK